jgi:hypothetical protein
MCRVQIKSLENLIQVRKFVMETPGVLSFLQILTIGTFKSSMGNFEISGSNNLFRHEKIASWS